MKTHAGPIPTRRPHSHTPTLPPAPHPSHSGDVSNLAATRPGAPSVVAAPAPIATPAAPVAPRPAAPAPAALPAAAPGTSVLVGNLEWWTTDADLEAAASAYGRLAAPPHFYTDRPTGRSKGAAVLRFVDTAAAAAAVAGLNGRVFDGKVAVATLAAGAGAAPPPPSPLAQPRPGSAPPRPAPVAPAGHARPWTGYVPRAQFQYRQQQHAPQQQHYRPRPVQQQPPPPGWGGPPQYQPPPPGAGPPPGVAGFKRPRQG